MIWTRLHTIYGTFVSLLHHMKSVRWRVWLTALGMRARTYNIKDLHKYVTQLYGATWKTQMSFGENVSFKTYECESFVRFTWNPNWEIFIWFPGKILSKWRDVSLLGTQLNLFLEHSIGLQHHTASSSDKGSQTTPRIWKLIYRFNFTQRRAWVEAFGGNMWVYIRFKNK